MNIRVIQILRAQKTWRDLVEEPGFSRLHFYNNNPSTKWPPILPLFSSGPEGLPHRDDEYVATWKEILLGMQGVLDGMGEQSLNRLCALERTDRSSTARCELDIKTNITPHSARVSVVSQYISILPAELIGKYITGQTPPVVHYYVKLNAEQLEEAQVQQALESRERAYRNGAEPFLSNGNRFVQPDDASSRLAISLRKNLAETLISYGCISITLNEEATSGLDVLRETRAANAVENKTEICPYGNHCPPEIIKQWRGSHRCGLCQYAVRSVDHLPAVAAKVKQFAEILVDLTERISAALEDPKRYSKSDLDRLEEERARYAEELAGWQLNEEILYSNKMRLAREHDKRAWVVQKPDVVLQDLRRVAAPTNATTYTLARLEECIAYPTLDSPAMRARFDLLRRTLLAKCGDLRQALASRMPIDPAAECAGLIRTLVGANRLGIQDIAEIIESDSRLSLRPTNVVLSILANNEEPKHVRALSASEASS